MVHTDIINIALNYKHILYIEIAYTNYFAGSSDIFIGKILVSNSSILFTCPSVDGKPYYNSGLFLNKSIDLTSTNL